MNYLQKSKEQDFFLRKKAERLFSKNPQKRYGKAAEYFLPVLIFIVSGICAFVALQGYQNFLELNTPIPPSYSFYVAVGIALLVQVCLFFAIETVYYEYFGENFYNPIFIAAAAIVLILNISAINFGAYRLNDSTVKSEKDSLIKIIDVKIAHQNSIVLENDNLHKYGYAKGSPAYVTRNKADSTRQALALEKDKLEKRLDVKAEANDFRNSIIIIFLDFITLFLTWLKCYYDYLKTCYQRDLIKQQDFIEQTVSLTAAQRQAEAEQAQTLSSLDKNFSAKSQEQNTENGVKVKKKTATTFSAQDKMKILMNLQEESEEKYTFYYLLIVERNTEDVVRYASNVQIKIGNVLQTKLSVPAVQSFIWLKVVLENEKKMVNNESFLLSNQMTEFMEMVQMVKVLIPSDELKQKVLSKYYIDGQHAERVKKQEITQKFFE